MQRWPGGTQTARVTIPLGGFQNPNIPIYGINSWRQETRKAEKKTMARDDTRKTAQSGLVPNIAHAQRCGSHQSVAYNQSRGVPRMLPRGAGPRNPRTQHTITSLRAQHNDHSLARTLSKRKKTAERSPAGMQHEHQVAAENNSSHLASTSRKPQLHSHRRTPHHACVATLPQRTMTSIP